MRAFFPLKSAVTFEVKGRDASRYLNSRLSNDVRSLKPGESIEAAALTAQGRVQALLRVVARSADEYLLVFDGGDSAELQKVILQFKVADRVELSDHSSRWALLHAVDHSDSGAAIPAVHTADPQWAHRRISDSGMDLLIAAERVAAWRAARIDLGWDELDQDSFRLQRFRYGHPSWPEEIDSSVILLESGRECAVSFKKGCYVGQEVIEKLDAYGKRPKVLLRLAVAGSEPITPGTPVLLHSASDNGQRLGEVRSSCDDPDSGEQLTFAYIKNRELSSTERLSVSGRSAALLPIRQ